MKYKKKGKTALWMSQHPDPTKSTATGEWSLFKQIALERSYGDEYKFVMAKHLNPDGTECEKAIALEDLQPINFSHKLAKKMHPKLRLDPNNIQIVSFRYHFWEHTRQIDKLDRRN